jgi:endonuclease VIII
LAEGDTIHRLARRIEATMGGEEIEAVSAPSPESPLHRSAARLAGRRLEAAEARGKHLLLSIEGGLVIRSHLRMRGAWHLYAPGERWRKPERSAWLALATDHAAAVMFGGAELELLKKSALPMHPRLAQLGPDILDSGFTTEQGVEALRGAGGRTPLGEALFDQGVIAGIGNVCKSEGCFAARVDPWRTVAAIEDEELAAVVERTAELMQASVENGRRPRAIYKRARRPCPRCRTPIRSRGQGDDNRTTYWCPRCQT